MKKDNKKIGIWMDYSSANMIEYYDNPSPIQTIESNFTLDVKENALRSSEYTMHNKENNYKAKYFKSLSEVIQTYDDVLLFGPCDAKKELYNILKDDHHYDKINIELKQSDKMTTNQLQAFVRHHFEHNNLMG
jgi:hypothetical protein